MSFGASSFSDSLTIYFFVSMMNDPSVLRRGSCDSEASAMHQDGRSESFVVPRTHTVFSSIQGTL